jgi:FRG domain-containing protein
LSLIFNCPKNGEGYTLESMDYAKGKLLEEIGIKEFENIILHNIGDTALRTVFNGQKYGKDWDLLFQAQHAGIKTTLTDWTNMITHALYFATEISDNTEIENSDSQVWCFMIAHDNIKTHNPFIINAPENVYSYYNLNPFQLENSIMINSPIHLDDINKRTFEYRMYKQKGSFFISPTSSCNIPINQQEYLSDFIFKYRIPAQNKMTIRKELELKGITREELYVDENYRIQSLINSINLRIFK